MLFVLLGELTLPNANFVFFLCFLFHLRNQVKSKGKELYAAVARHMSSLGMKSTDLFGLAIQIGESIT